MLFFFFKQKTAYEMRISDWSSDVCSSDLLTNAEGSANSVNADPQKAETYEIGGKWDVIHEALSLNVALFRTTVSNEINSQDTIDGVALQTGKKRVQGVELSAIGNITDNWAISARSEEHTSELQSLMRI